MSSSRRRGPKNGLLTLSLLAAAGAGAAGAQSPASSFVVAPSPISARLAVFPGSPATPGTPSIPVFTPVAARTKIEELPQSPEKKRIDLSDAETGLTEEPTIEKEVVTISKTEEETLYEDIDEDEDGDAFDYDGADEDEESESDIDTHPAATLAKRSSGDEGMIEGSTSFMLAKRAKKCKKNYKRNKKGKCVKKKKSAGFSTASARPYAAVGAALLAVMLVMSHL